MRKMIWGILAAGLLAMVPWICGAAKGAEEEAEDKKEDVRALSVVFNEASRLVKDDDSGSDLQGSVPLPGYSAYYREAIEVTILTADQMPQPSCEEDKEEPVSCEVLVFGEETEAWEPKIEWEIKEEGRRGQFRIEEEGRYRVSVRYGDEDYESVPLILDKTGPKIAAEWVDETGREAKPDRTDGDRLYFNRGVYLRITIEEENLRLGELKRSLEKMSARDISGTPLSTRAAEEINRMEDSKLLSGESVWMIPFAEDAFYEIPVECEDLAGNQSGCIRAEAVVDQTEPELEIFCEAESGGYTDMESYRKYGWIFADSPAVIIISAKDRTSGIEMISCEAAEGDGEPAEYAERFSARGEGRLVFRPPEEGGDYKGILTITAADAAGNQAGRSCTLVVESKERHREEGRLELSPLTSPSRTVNGEDYYNTDIRLRLEAKERFSGLSSVFTEGRAMPERTVDFAERAGEHAQDPVTYEYAEEFTVASEENNRNDILIRAGYRDNAGHEERTEQVFHIDITPPVLEVEYDLNQEESRFYREARTATVRIRERNFDARDVEFTITNTEGAMPMIGDWSESGEGDETVHTCRIVFSEDGDYTFRAAFQDLAGNRADYDRTDEFTIDTTAPELSVIYDNYEADNGYYYAVGRTAVVDIEERNFDPASVKISVTANGEESAGLVSGWREDGDHHRASVSFLTDADYTLEVKGADLAGNPMEAYGTETFVVDTTAPELEIYGIENRSANNGPIMPSVRCSDKNYDPGGELFLLEGSLNGRQEPAGVRTEYDDGMEFHFEDFAYVPQADDLYTLRASARDLAGNESRAQIVFSVNRFGSVYTLDKETQEMVDGRYIREEQDVVVTETNVDTLEFREITCSVNGRLKRLEEGKDYAIEIKGTSESWKQYVYRIRKNNFTEEGIYNLTFYSEDRAENAADNHTRGKELFFIVDKSAPSIVLSGIEDDESYREGSRTVTIDIQDNIALSEAEFVLNGERTRYSAEELRECGGRLVLTVPGAGDWQELSVAARDAAGNRISTGDIRFLVTPDVLVQLLMGRPSAFWILCALAAAIAGIAALSLLIPIAFSTRKVL